jgi:hypothetical protein
LFSIVFRGFLEFWQSFTRQGMNESEQRDGVLGSPAKAPLTPLKPALALEKDGSTIEIHTAFVEYAVGELVSVNRNHLTLKDFIVERCHTSATVAKLKWLVKYIIALGEEMKNNLWAQ